MGWAARVGWAVLGLGVVGCDGGAGGGSVHAAARPAAVALAGSCTVDGVRIEVEEGVLGGFTGESPCSYSGRFVSVWRATYEERWGAVALESWTVRIRAGERVDALGHGGLTWYRRAAHRAEPAPLRAPAARAAPRGAGGGVERPPRLVRGLRALGARAAHPGRAGPARVRCLKPA